MASEKKRKSERVEGSKSKEQHGAKGHADRASRANPDISGEEGIRGNEHGLLENAPLIGLIAVVVVAIAAAAVIIPGINPSFSTFKSNFQSAPRIAITVKYTNATAYNSETSCFTDIVEVVSRYKSPSAIDFYTIDGNNCTYSPTGLGHQINPVTTNASECLSKAYSEPGIFLNYSQANRTLITASHLYIYGNGAYYNECPIAVDLS